jgi:uncharacterized protein (UPF0276 family)
MLSHGEWIDSHSHAVHAEVFELLDHLLARAAPDVIIIERDGNWTGADSDVRDDLIRVRQIVARHQQPDTTQHTQFAAAGTPQRTAAGAKGL